MEELVPQADPVQLARDIETLQALQLEGFAGPVWEARKADLLAYGTATLPKKITTGEIFALMVKAGVPPAGDLALPRRGVGQEEAWDLAVDVCVAALPRFRQILMSTYNPYRERPACIDSYFFGCCLLHFRGPWRRWLRELRHHAQEPQLALKDLRERPGGDVDPASRAVARLEAERGLAALGPKYQAYAALDALGFTAPQAARRLGTTTKTVEGRLRQAGKIFERLRENSPDAA